MKKFILTILLISVITTANALTNNTLSTNLSEIYRYPRFVIQKKNQILEIKMLQEDNKTIEDIWNIEPKMVQSFITTDECLEIDANCDLSDPRARNMCVDPCLFDGPEFVEFDSTSKNIYFFNQLGVGGNVGTSAMLFMADPYHKKIKKLAPTYTFISNAKLNPSKSILALALSHISAIQFVQISNGQSFEIPLPSKMENNKDNNIDKSPVYYIENLHWLDETHLQFNEEKYPNKWANRPQSTSKKMVAIDFNRKTGHFTSY